MVTKTIMLDNLRKYKILLASKSPRRHELLSQLRIPFSIITMGGIDETYPDNIPSEEIPIYLANKKCDACMAKLDDDNLIITADTLVIYDNKALGKPKGREEAIEMLTQLSGKVHKVVTGVSICTTIKRTTFSVCTEVKFAEISAKDIAYYVDNFMPYDKAGAYGIQEWIGYIGVEWIKGSFFNVMGLPVHQLYVELKNF